MSTYLIWILASNLILLHNQLKATLRLLDTCLIVGLLPLIFIFDHDVVVLKDFQLRIFLVKNVCLWERSPHATIYQYGVMLQMKCHLLNATLFFATSHKSTAENSSIRSPVPNEMISDSVELWDADVCFLHNQLMGTNVRLPKIHKIPSRG